MKRVLMFGGLILWCFSGSANEYGYKKITVLTAPIGRNDVSWRGGPSSVKRSVIDGLQKLGIPFNVNPQSITEVGDVVHVLSNIDALRQAIQLKRDGRIKKLLAGPNLMVRSNEVNHLLASPEIDICIVPCDWVKNAYREDEISLKNRIQSWYAGVDTDFWCPPVKKSASNNVLIYCKLNQSGYEQFYQKVEEILRKNQWVPVRICYGSYSSEQFKQLLSKVAFSVFLSRSESQGIAYAESWSMGVPTLCWDPNEPLWIQGKCYWPVASCPYINPNVGASWKNFDELEGLVKSIKDLLPAFSPREWVLQNMSDEVSAQLLLKIVQSEPNAAIPSII
jgi:hypothetical protein